jgi:hypothetical protein
VDLHLGLRTTGYEAGTFARSGPDTDTARAVSCDEAETARRPLLRLMDTDTVTPLAAAFLFGGRSSFELDQK